MVSRIDILRWQRIKRHKLIVFFLDRSKCLGMFGNSVLNLLNETTTLKKLSEEILTKTIHIIKNNIIIHKCALIDYILNNFRYVGSTVIFSINVFFYFLIASTYVLHAAVRKNKQKLFNHSILSVFKF